MINVKGFLKDVGGASRVTKARREKLERASAVPQPKDPIRELADKLHPLEMRFKVTDIRDASPTAKTFRFESLDGHIPVFQSGQYVNFRLQIGDSLRRQPADPPLHDRLRAVRGARRQAVFRGDDPPQRAVSRAGLPL